jgi:hypothetical protein
MKTFRISGRFGMALCGAALLATVPVMAHHSAAMFDGARVI